jgi:hypothetical protein
MTAWRTKWIRTLSSAASAGPCAGCVDSPASLGEGRFDEFFSQGEALGSFAKERPEKAGEIRALATTQQPRERLDADVTRFPCSIPRDDSRNVRARTDA